MDRQNSGVSEMHMQIHHVRLGTYHMYGLVHEFLVAPRDRQYALHAEDVRAFLLQDFGDKVVHEQHVDVAAYHDTQAANGAIVQMRALGVEELRGHF